MDGIFLDAMAASDQFYDATDIAADIVDPGRINPATIMPAYHRTDRLVRVAPARRGKPVLSAEQIEDVVAFLMTLKN